MGAYIVRRVLQSVPVLFLLTVITFLLVSASPGGVAAFMGNSSTGLVETPQEIARFRHIYGLDAPLPVQYVHWLGGILHGNLGLSYQFSEPVGHILGRTVPLTLLLMGCAILLALLISIPIGVISAYKRNTIADYLATFLAFVGISVPTFWLALVSLLVFGVLFPILPTSGISSSPGSPFSLTDLLAHLVLPSFVLALPIAGAWTRFIRSNMLDVLAEPYIRTAQAKGLGERMILLSHALRNALLPLITLIGITITYTASNSAVVEYVFQLPGLGQQYILTATSFHDLPMIMGGLMVVSVLAVLGSLFADLAYAIADPRIRLS
jgi:peptide/nickel transport system permease protein